MHHSKRLAAYTFAPLVAAVLAVTAVTVQACRVRTLRAADAPENVDVRAVGVSTDTVWFEVSCAPVADENGAADAYIDSVFVGSTLVHAARVTVPADTFGVARPGPGGTVTLTVRMRAVRRTLVGPASEHAWSFTEVDTPPPAPDSIAVDTINHTSSTPNLMRVSPDRVTVIAGDSTLVRAVEITADGDTLAVDAETLAWRSADTSAVRVHPVAGTANAWLITVRDTAGAL